MRPSWQHPTRGPQRQPAMQRTLVRSVEHALGWAQPTGGDHVLAALEMPTAQQERPAGRAKLLARCVPGRLSALQSVNRVRRAVRPASRVRPPLEVRRTKLAGSTDGGEVIARPLPVGGADRCQRLGQTHGSPTSTDGFSSISAMKRNILLHRDADSVRAGDERVCRDVAKPPRPADPKHLQRRPDRRRYAASRDWRGVGKGHARAVSPALPSTG
jgi:hypothetical protein